MLAIFRDLWVHELSRWSSFSRSKRHEVCLIVESIWGAPRYLEGKELMGKPRIRAMALWTTGGVWKKKIWDLVLLMLVPEAYAKSFSRDLYIEASWTDGYPNNMLSSTNCWWVIARELWIERPLICWERQAWLIWHPKPSAIRTKRKVERGSPCQMPLEGLKGWYGMPLMRMEKKEEDIRLWIHQTHIGEKPKVINIFCMYIQLSLSKAFDKSSLRIIPACLVCLRECMTLCERMMPSKICRPST